jgi:hypothetical protein
VERIAEVGKLFVRGKDASNDLLSWCDFRVISEIDSILLVRPQELMGWLVAGAERSFGTGKYRAVG